MTSVPDRDLRQRDIVPPDRLAACKATVVGVGAWVAKSRCNWPLWASRGSS